MHAGVTIRQGNREARERLCRYGARPAVSLQRLSRDNSVSEYTIGVDGTLAPMAPATVAAGAAPVSVTIDPSGRFAYVANYAGNDVSLYGIGTNGALAPLPPATVMAGAAPYAITTAGTIR